ncbi:MAG: MerR family transcriptional regulator [Ignavibacteriaceae bacterium]|nr:MerR family transcriptional regulator [Ignavibacteriaceae bacterium]
MKDLSIKKLYYSISEVSKITDMEQYVLRYWESEFEQLNPQKNRAGNRIYTNKDIQIILNIKSLLREKKYTIEGAKKILVNFKQDPDIVKSESESSIENENIVTTQGDNKKEKPSVRKDLKEMKLFLEYLLSKI